MLLRSERGALRLVMREQESGEKREGLNFNRVLIQRQINYLSVV